MEPISNRFVVFTSMGSNTGKPRANLLTYHEDLASNAAWHAEVVPDSF